MNHIHEFYLNGLWRFRCDPEELGEHFPQQLDIPWKYDARWMRLAYDDGDWANITVPSCWQQAGYDYNGVAWYRKLFPNPLRDSSDTRVWLRFEGVDYFSDLWLNEHYLGSHEGYFVAFQHEITPYLLPGENLLVVRVDSPNDIKNKENQVGQLKTLIKGALQRWDANNPEVNPGGIWNDVKLITTGPGAITGIQVRARIDQLPDRPGSAEAIPAQAVVSVRVGGFPQEALHSSARLRVTFTPVNFEGEEVEALLSFTALPQCCEWPVPVVLDQARLWYTWDTGEPCLYRVTATVEVDGHISDQVSQMFGFRHLERGQGWEMYLNGIRIFQRGANYLSDQFLSTMSQARYEQDIRLLREANLNTVHPFCIVEKQVFYDLCDQHGLLVYQDFPMWLMMANTGDLVRRATQQLRALIEQFGHHPSICIWNLGSQASVANFEKLGAALEHVARQLDPTRLVQRSNALVDIGTQDEMPSDPVGTFHWTERVVADFQERFDWRVDTHQYRGWYSKKLDALATIPREHLELVTEYGAQALPSREMLEQFIPPESLFPPDWPHYTRRCFQPEYQFRYIAEPTSLEQFIKDSQAYQARFLQYHTEYYRRHKFDPCNGAHMFCFNDCWPAITWSVVDYERQPKEGFYALKRAMAPLQVILDPVLGLQAGAKIEQTLWIVNDFPRAFDDLDLAWVIVREGDGTIVGEGNLSCRAAANSLQQIGCIKWMLEEQHSYSVSLELRQGSTLVAENHYQLTHTRV